MRFQAHTVSDYACALAKSEIARAASLRMAAKSPLFRFTCPSRRYRMHPGRHGSPDHPQIAQRKHHLQLRRVLCQPPIAHLPVPALAFDHPKRVLGFGSYACLQPLHPVGQCIHRVGCGFKRSAAPGTSLHASAHAPSHQHACPRPDSPHRRTRTPPARAASCCPRPRR